MKNNKSINTPACKTIMQDYQRLSIPFSIAENYLTIVLDESCTQIINIRMRSDNLCFSMNFRISNLANINLNKTGFCRYYAEKLTYLLIYQLFI